MGFICFNYLTILKKKKGWTPVKGIIVSSIAFVSSLFVLLILGC